MDVQGKSDALDSTQKRVLDSRFTRHLETATTRELTLNQRGFMYLQVDRHAYEPWVMSLPSSGKPLLDLGAAYGVHTLNALQRNRDVIAVDCEPTHLEILKGRVRGEPKVHGKLVRVSRATLPVGDVCARAEVAGILLTEVLHFLKPGEPECFFKDAYRWLSEGGCLALTTASSFSLRIKPYDRIVSDCRIKTIGDFIDYATDDELVEFPPTFMLNEEGTLFRKVVGESAYGMSTREVGIFARRAGFQIKILQYISTKKYPVANSFENNEVLLVAYKPYANIESN